MSSLPSDSAEGFIISHDSRCNSSPVALGNLSRSRCCRRTFIWSPDAFNQLIPVSITSALVFGVVFTLWNDLGVAELVFLFFLLSIAYTSAFILSSSDPGVYPRLRLSEVDPLRDRMELVYCRVCNLRRPPRTSHCYECNVCVREHDHHCGVLGGCVGQRTMRWFVLYLISISGACILGLLWLIRGLLRLGPMVVMPSTNSSTVRNVSDRGAAPSSAAYKGEDVKAAAIIVMFIILVLITMLVGGLAGYYLYLVATSTTRREAQKRTPRTHTSFTLKGMVSNVVNVIYPPPSLLIEPAGASDVHMV
ncbi:palmitoyl acyltransferase 9, putative [Trypanosoma equiperdum]|uniref:Palmitoyltransferase n=4 Tax=Trypanozoon TaxID=39700 RepID=Q384S9_TRYB2|nr:hypothetical protein, conserved [Trypanosoma brucei gambiense DAL972]XP_828814.1 hypothetical protein, conserved [Trypanosoma brucei brucei TREU927]RHW67288.1 palmitoyl acyltransferase 9 [Trypanosoma brucei equiperdum]SCU70844.1 palmitoyl acyltransferase 9, putative [Trypanosoma equiperdum]EAN79702.1 hypothetical protein, conserved [Trypanosoma brucei brucei TREU927]CBH17722.1 hypothetical protein, conserved [Trypanosoma brucei gambiense DAL972]|eukprot:XP_011779986.1 hypothetical protein, conserved [Trypanosoma brucei gambiense DAL972]